MVRPFAGFRADRHPWWPGALLGAAALVALTVVALRSTREPLTVSLPGVPPQPQAPAPPDQAPWVSPLSRQCTVNDPTLVARLRTQQRSLPDQLQKVTIDPSNYGERLSRDAFGNPLDTTPSLVVLHETVYGIGSAINTFTTHHPHDDDQVSYHLLIGERGQLLQTLDLSKRAFGAGYSAFEGRWVVTNPQMSGSVNNFALHVSLETPLDGEDADAGHSGYSPQQYDGLAVVLADWMKRYRIPFNHITTHRHIDLGAARADPRSFDWQALQVRLAALGALC
jgi:N-acetyl-anhydromuramyl-L-alanine amidase AmpD